ncbi:MAG: RluA family pseudouridine synthase [Panacagrimonas sp.]|nr:RluA family pseudouridine synthase [Panacagrimonas sp.]
MTQPATAVRHVRAGAREDGQRIDNFLLRQLPGVPKSHVYRLLRSGQVRVNGGRAKPERKLVEGDEIRIPPVRMAEKGEAVRPPDDVLNRLREAVIHEDEHYLALDKPAGYASHGGSGLPYGVIESIRAWNKYEFIELCHRLDRDTSGVLLLAKSRPALLRAQKAFKEGTTEKRYFALLVGRWKGEDRDVDAALVKNNVAGGERYVDVDEEEGKPSRSRFSPQARYRDATLCEVQIFSGRTHQIRVHALALGYPVAGDRKYGDRGFDKAIRDKGLKRMFLHSHFLKLAADGALPKLLLNAPLTDELRDVLSRLPTISTTGSSARRAR